MLLPGGSFFDFNRRLGFNLRFDLGLEFQNSRAERFVDRNFLTQNLETDDERVSCGGLGVAAPATMSPDGDAQVVEARRWT